MSTATLTRQSTSKKRLKPGYLKEEPNYLTHCVKKFARLASKAYASTAAYELEHCGKVSANPALRASDYDDPVMFKHDYLCYNILRKFVPYTDSDDSSLADRAISKFVAVDRQLKEVNDFLSWDNPLLYEAAGNSIGILRAARKQIASILGDHPSLDQLISRASFSGGATRSTPRIKGAPAFKFSFENPEVTYGCLPIALWSRSETPMWDHRGFTPVPGNRVTTVPKDSDIDRPIACEPLFNMWLQKSVGSIIRSKLNRVGINLNYQQLINQRLARKGSIDGSLATIDLSAASDSISLGICKLLLPRSWYLLLLSLRSDSGLLPNGDTIVYNKMSSMGNGFTFELETLIFYALTQATENSVAQSEGVVRNRCSVYGDDIICSTAAVEPLVKVLSLCGFSTNKDKSFWTGPFRESCGKHYFNGIDVTPFYIKETPKYITDLFKIANNLRRWADIFGFTPDGYVPALNYIISIIRNGYPRFTKPKIPPYMGDGALIGRFDEVHKRFNTNKTYNVDVFVERTALIGSEHKKFKELSSVLHGYGGYLSSLAVMANINDVDTDGTVIPYDNVIDKLLSIQSTVCIDSTSLRGDLTDKVRLPGVIEIRRTSVEILSWSDPIPSLTQRTAVAVLEKWFGLDPCG